MSLKRSNSGGRSFGGAGGDAGGKVDRQELFDELKRLAGTGEAFTSVDIALAIGAGEPLVSKSLLGLAAEGYVERVEGGQYRSSPMAETTQAEFVKAYARASKVDSTRQRDLSEIGRLRQNNDVMRQRLLTAIAERDYYLGILKARGIDPGTPPGAAPPTATAGPAASASAASAPAASASAASASAAHMTGRASAQAPTGASNPAGSGDASGEDPAAPGPAGLAVPSPRSESERLPSGPGDAGPVDSGS